MLPFVIFFVSLCAVLLLVSTRFFRLMDMEKLRRDGLPYEHLLEDRPSILFRHPGRLVIGILAVYVGGPVLILLFHAISSDRRLRFGEAWSYLWKQDTLLVAAAVLAYVAVLYIVGRIVVRFMPLEAPIADTAEDRPGRTTGHGEPPSSDTNSDPPRS